MLALLIFKSISKIAQVNSNCPAIYQDELIWINKKRTERWFMGNTEARCFANLIKNFLMLRVLMKIDVAGFLWNTGVRSIICLCLNELRYPSIEYAFFSFQSTFLHHLFVKLTFISAVLVPGFFFRGLSKFCNFSWSNRLIYGQFNFLEIFFCLLLWRCPFWFLPCMGEKLMAQSIQFG